MMEYLPLIGIAIIVVGFLLRINPLLVVTAAALATGLAAQLQFTIVLDALGKAFNENRFITVVYVVLPAIGLLERYGLQQRSRAVILKLHRATVGRLLIVYLVIRQAAAAIGLTSVAGHPQTVRPLVAPMAEAAAEREHGKIDEATRDKVKAYAAATDNVGLFFGEDIFIAIASILLIKGNLATHGINLDPLELSLWAIPTAILAFLIHASRLIWLDRSLRRGAKP